MRADFGRAHQRIAYNRALGKATRDLGFVPNARQIARLADTYEEHGAPYIVRKSA
jgi:hypothetical protein